jgi:NADH dehydrogenase FAD-containing subunit
VTLGERHGLHGQVVIYGGGVAGAKLARKLRGRAEVIVVDPLDYFEIPMAAPRNLVQPDFAERAILPFAEALPEVQHVRGKLVELCAQGGWVQMPGGRRLLISADISVLATGSRFANSLVRGIEGSVSERKALYARFHERLRVTRRVLIVGGGPIGVEIAGEISQTWPEKVITLIEAGPRLLAGTSEEAAAHAAAVLAGRGVAIITGDRLDGDKHVPNEIFGAGGIAMTAAGRQIPYDLLLWCVGGRPNTGYMSAHFSEALNDRGQVRVTSDLRVVGLNHVFAVGDITDLAENKMAWVVGGHVSVVAANIGNVLNGGSGTKRYKAKTGNPMMAVTLGSQTGVTQLPKPIGLVRAAWVNRKLKATHMLVPMNRRTFGM